MSDTEPISPTIDDVVDLVVSTPPVVAPVISATVSAVSTVSAAAAAAAAAVAAHLSIPPPLDELAPIPRRPVMSADALRAVQETTRSIKVSRRTAEASTTVAVHEDWWSNVMKHAADLHLDNITELVSQASKVAAQEDQAFVDYELTFTRNLDYDHYVAKFPRSRAAITYQNCIRERGTSVHLDAAFDSLKIEFARRVFSKCGVRDVCALIRREMPGVQVDLRSRLDPTEPAVIHVTWKKDKKTLMSRLKKWIVRPIVRFVDGLPVPHVVF